MPEAGNSAVFFQKKPHPVAAFPALFFGDTRAERDAMCAEHQVLPRLSTTQNAAVLTAAFVVAF